MIEVTERAAAKVVSLADRDGRARRLRLGVRGGGCSGLMFFWDFDERSRDNDRVWTVGDLEVVCDPKSWDYLDGSRFDYEDKNLLKRGFRFSNPEAKRSCSCGESFAV